MNYNEFDSQSPAAAQPQGATKREVKTYETVFAWIALLLGYLFCRALPASRHPLGAMLVIFALYAVGGAFLISAHARQTPRSLFYLISPLLLSLSLFLSSNSFLHALTFMWALLCFTFWVTLSFGGGLEAHARDLLFYDFLKALLVMPFSSFGSLFRSLFPKRKKDGKGYGKQVMFAVLGLLIAIIPTTIVILLLSYDNKFSNIMNQIDLSVLDIPENIIYFAFGIPLAAYGFGAFISGSDRKHQQYMSAASCRKFSGESKFVPAIMACFAILPLILVYCVFFVSQWDYYLAAFAGKLPDGHDVYSLYAREGFFQLCTVSGINAAIMLLISVFTKRREDGVPTVIVRVFTALLSLSTIILIATAISKMALYITMYGLTRHRVYASWFMLMLAVAFVIMLIKQIFPKTNASLSLLIAFVLLFGVLALSCPDRLIAKYNVDRYLEGTLTNPDANMLIGECGDAAVGEVIRLYRDVEERGNSTHYLDELRSLLENWRQKDQRKDDIFSVTLPRLMARRAYFECFGADAEQ